MVNIKESFEKFDDDYIDFAKVEDKLHPRPDMCAFLLLDKLYPGVSDMVSAAEHDKIWLDVDCEKLSEAATE